MKINYTRELIDKCKPIFKQGLKYIFSHSKKNTALQKHLFRTFQENLEKIPKWNSMIVLKEFDRFKINSNCSWLDKLIKASFLAEFKMASNNIDMKIDVPKSQDFIHFCYIGIARELWKKPQIMFDGFTNELRKTYEIELDAIIETTIIKVIKDLLPLEKLINNYLKSIDETEYNSDDDEKKSLSCDDSQINNSDDDSSDYDDSEDESDKKESMTHIFNEDVNKVTDITISKSGGNDENNSSQEIVDTINIENEKITTESEVENNVDINDDVSNDTTVISVEKSLSLDGETDNMVVEPPDDVVIHNDDVTQQVELSIEDPLVPGNIETPFPVIQNTNELFENTKTVHVEGNNFDDEEVVHIPLQVKPINTLVQVEPSNIVTHEKVIDMNDLDKVDDINTSQTDITYIPNEEKNTNTSTDDMEKKIIKLGYDEIEANNKKKIKNILGIDMNYYDFIKKKNRLRKSLLTKTTA